MDCPFPSVNWRSTAARLVPRSARDRRGSARIESCVQRHILEVVAIIATSPRHGTHAHDASRPRLPPRSCAAQNLLRQRVITLSSNHMDWPEDGRRRAFIEQVRPAVDCGRSAVKRVLGEAVDVEADVIVEGHERIACMLLHAPVGGASWISVPMTPLGDDSWAASFVPATLGRHRYTVAAWPDAFATWRNKLLRRTERDDIAIALREGAALVRAAATRARGAERGALLAYAATLDGDAPLEERRQSALTEALRELMAAAPDRSFETVYAPPLEVVVERPLARFSAWYEFFPRSAVEAPARHGTLATAARTARVRRRHGLRRRLSTADSSDRPESPEGPQQQPTRDRARPGLAVGDRCGRRRTQERARRARHARRLRDVSARSGTARAGDRARSRVPVLAGPSVRRRASAVVRAPTRRQRAVRRESAEEVRGHLPARFRHGGMAGLVAGAQRRRRVLDRQRRPRVSRRQSAHEAVRLLALAHRRRTEPASRHAVSRRSIQSAARDVQARQARLQPVVYLFHVAQHEAGAHGLFHRARHETRLLSP